MEFEFMIGDFITDYGYFGLFLWLWFGVFGIPIPNEAIVMSIGFAASEKLFLPSTSFIITYLGLLAGVTTVYLLGRMAGGQFISWLEKKDKRKRRVNKALQLIEKYHSFSLCMSYFIPGMRNFVPFCYGLSKLSFRRFALVTYSTILVWQTLFFILGYKLGNNTGVILKYDQEIFISAGLLVLLAFSVRFFLLKKVKSSRSHLND